LFVVKKQQIACNSCIFKNKPEFISYKIDNVKCLSLYPYDDYFKEQLYRFKACFDIELSKSFLFPYTNELKLIFHGYKMVPVPSHVIDDSRRGFNHVEEIFKHINLPLIKVLTKINHVKQSDRNYNQRQLIKYDMKVNNYNEIFNSKILIVDDICTSGSTLKAAIELIREGSPKQIKILTLCKVPYKVC
jgi:predicted amidophosphoribosyltransferase